MSNVIISEFNDIFYEVVINPDNSDVSELKEPDYKYKLISKLFKNIYHFIYKFADTIKDLYYELEDDIKEEILILKPEKLDINNFIPQIKDFNFCFFECKDDKDEYKTTFDILLNYMQCFKEIIKLYGDKDKKENLIKSRSYNSLYEPLLAINECITLFDCGIFSNNNEETIIQMLDSEYYISRFINGIEIFMKNGIFDDLSDELKNYIKQLILTDEKYDEDYNVFIDYFNEDELKDIKNYKFIENIKLVDEKFTELNYSDYYPSIDERIKINEEFNETYFKFINFLYSLFLFYYDKLEFIKI